MVVDHPLAVDASNAITRNTKQCPHQPYIDRLELSSFPVDVPILQLRIANITQMIIFHTVYNSKILEPEAETCMLYFCIVQLSIQYCFLAWLHYLDIWGQDLEI